MNIERDWFVFTLLIEGTIQPVSKSFLPQHLIAKIDEAIAAHGGMGNDEAMEISGLYGASLFGPFTQEAANNFAEQLRSKVTNALAEALAMIGALAGTNYTNN